MSIFLIDKIKPINDQFPVYDDTDGYGGFQVRQDVTDRNSIPELNRKPGMLVYTITDAKFWQLVGGISNTDWAVAAFGSGGGGGGGITLPASSANQVLLTDGYNNLDFDKISNEHVSVSASISGTKIVPEFGAQNIISDGYSSVVDGYFDGSLLLSGIQSFSVPSISAGNGKGIIYFDDVSKKFKASQDGYSWINLIGRSTLSIAEISFLSGISVTSETVFQNIGAIHFDISKVADGYSSIKLKTIINTTGVPCEIILYDHNQGQAITLKAPSKEITTSSMTPVVLESDNISSIMSPNSLYDVRIRIAQSTSTPTDQVICQMCKLVIEWP